jgi:hypothetical protein
MSKDVALRKWASCVLLNCNLPKPNFLRDWAKRIAPHGLWLCIHTGESVPAPMVWVSNPNYRLGSTEPEGEFVPDPWPEDNVVFVTRTELAEALIAGAESFFVLLTVGRVVCL